MRTESQNFIVQGDHYHAPLRRIFHIFRTGYEMIEPEVILRYSVNSINDFMGLEAIFSSLLVFGIIPTFTVTESDRPEQSELLAAMDNSRDEMAKICTELRIQTALKSQLLLLKKYHLSSVEIVRVYSVRSNCWEGAFRITKTREQ